MNLHPLSPNGVWDIFCRVIDNFGDIGVCWRLSVNLARRGQTVRLWIDDPSALNWMAPQGQPGVQVLVWTTPFELHGLTPGEVLVEAFGCEVAPEFIAAYARQLRVNGQASRWINLEYLSAEDFARRCHGLPSPVLSGPGQGLTKYFFYPGFLPGSGGLLREPDLLARQAEFDRTRWLAQQHIDWTGQRLVSLFCYESAGLPALLQALAADAVPTLLLVTDGQAAKALRQLLQDPGAFAAGQLPPNQLSVVYLPTLSQPDFDHLLWTCELNFVRGEDSLVRALWAGQPFIWQIYPQDDDAHHIKLNAFLDWLQAPATLRRAYRVWNALPPGSGAPAGPLISGALLQDWQACFKKARQSLLDQDDLASALLKFTSKTN